MKIATLDIDKFIKAKGCREVTSHNIGGPGTLFDPDIFGTGELAKEKFGFIRLHGYFIDPATYDASYRILPFLEDIVQQNKKFIITDQGDLMVDNENGETGLKWYYDNYSRIKIKRLIDTAGNKYQTRAMKQSFAKMTREQFFTNKTMVLPLYLRDIDTSEGKVKMDELNQMYIDLIKACNTKKSLVGTKLSTAFIDARIQDILLEIYNYNKNSTFGGPNSKGLQRDGLLGRSVDNGARIVISAPEVKNTDIIGKSKYQLDYLNLPLHHILNMYPKQTISSVIKILKTFWEFEIIKDPEITNDFDFTMYYSDDIIEKKIKSYSNNYMDRYDTIKTPSGDNIHFYISYDNGKFFRRPITWIDVFYLAVDSFKDLVRCMTVRYPATDKGSTVFTKIGIEVFNGDDMKQARIKFNDKEVNPRFKFEDYPFIGEKVIKEAHKFEETAKSSCLYLEGQTGDFDGDKNVPKSVYSEEAVREIDRFNNTPTSLLRFDGSPMRVLGKEPIQTFYNLTETKRPFKDPIKKEYVDKKDIDFLCNGSDFTMGSILELFTRYNYNSKVKLRANFGKNHIVADSTLGKLIFNTVVLGEIKHKPFYKYINNTLTNSEINKILRYYSDEMIEASIKTINFKGTDEEYRKLQESMLTVEEYKGILNRFNDIGMGLTDIVCSNLSLGMIINDDEVFKKKREEIYKKYQKNIEEKNDIVAFNDYENEVIAFAKEHYKDEEMVDLYESGSKPKWDNDFKSIKVSLGAIPSPTGEVTLVKSNLGDGITNEDILPTAQMQIMGAASRAIETADAGYLVKKLTAALQSLKGYRTDCKTTLTDKVKTNKKDDLMYRYVMEGTRPVLITKDNVNKYLNKEIKLRSPMFCRHKEGLCSICAGELPFAMAQSEKVDLGIQIVYIGSTILNAFMKRTHDMKQKMYEIKDLNDFLDN